MRKRAWWLIVLTLLVPGSAQLVAGNRKLARIGITATLGFWALALLAIIIGLINRSWLVAIVTMPILVGFLAIVLFGYAIVLDRKSVV